ncbi:hypothetical protein [Saccharospirillum mangrovi]|uniref:hypothetical protein n=1 Tax=Saccharospirillum mangrovi TaxID=2161747 RepID=UPI000D3A1CD9|nr:hypothetical protein [Saccharospirillum mangrovi]
MTEPTLGQFIPSPVLAVAATYLDDGRDTDVYICGAEVQSDNRLMLRFARGHRLSVGARVTVHLDNRTGVSEYDAELRVYRLSYKGQVVRLDDNRVLVEPVQFQVFYGLSVVLDFAQSGYHFPDDQRPERSLPTTPMTTLPKIDGGEHDNKVGVLVTRAEQQPHTTVMAFLSTQDDDIFFITFPSTFKSTLLKRDNRCLFAIDNRATFAFEHAIEWNYSIISGQAFDVPKNTELFRAIQEAFIAKNPWEVGFFSNPEVEMFHLRAEHLICPAPHIPG